MSLNVEIEKDTKERATECEKNFACLTDKNHVLCVVERCVKITSYLSNGWTQSIALTRCLSDSLCGYVIALSGKSSSKDTRFK